MLRTQLAGFIERMDENSVAILPSARETTRSNDTQFRYRQDSDFYYLTGFNEPEAIAVITPANKEQRYTLFVRPRDPEREIWDGYRAGVEGARTEHGADAAFDIAEFPEKLGELLNNTRSLYYRIGVDAELDDTVVRQMRRMRAGVRRGMTAPQSIIDPATILHEMRLIKAEDEIAIMQRSAEIAAEAHREAMKATKPGMNEYEIEALIEYIFRRNGALAPAYTSIVGAGANATILHYVNNDAMMHDGDLLLVDAGAEFKGYASDITRTFPVNGRYTPAQADIYNLVLDAQMQCIEMIKPGVTMEEMHQRSVEVLTGGMVRLGLLEGEPAKLIEEEKYKKFYMHRLGHYLGMDVHDVGRYIIDGEYRPIQAGMVMTVEPGLYVAQDATDIPDQYRGIGVRIEDDVLVTDDGYRVLTHEAPKQIEEIEQLMAAG
ncbi:MAG TPA: Xaa-Pro aminopeptidase [Pyrinomonadaceae bacterium]|nr:Xaa-Pro aminopeptidase [Pyrinomonadaceae bacterium]